MLSTEGGQGRVGGREGACCAPSQPPVPKWPDAAAGPRRMQEPTSYSPPQAAGAGEVVGAAAQAAGPAIGLHLAQGVDIGQAVGAARQVSSPAGGTAGGGNAVAPPQRLSHQAQRQPACVLQLPCSGSGRQQRRRVFTACAPTGAGPAAAGAEVAAAPVAGRWTRTQRANLKSAPRR